MALTPLELERLMAAIPSAAFTPTNNEFEAKLTFEQRCEVLAFCLRGVRRAVVAAAFGLHRRTVDFVVNEQSRHYKRVREEEKKLGRDVFIRTYVTEEGSMKVAKAIVDMGNQEGEAAMTKAYYVDHRSKEQVQSKRKNKHAGSQLISNDATSTPHRVDIDYVEDHPKGPGWYYKDVTLGDTEWLNGPDGPFPSSTACYNFLVEDIAD